MLVEVSLSELVDLLGADVDDKNVQALIVVEARGAFTGVGLVEITCDDHGVALGFFGALARCGTDECDLFCVRRPREIFSCAGQWGVCSGQGHEEGSFAASGWGIISPCLSPSEPVNAIHLLSIDQSGLPAGLSPPRRTILPEFTSITQSWP